MSYFHAVAVAVTIVATASADKARQSLASEDYLAQAVRSRARAQR
jgi:hypothetical protein